MIKHLLLVLVALLPSKLKILCYRLLGARIGSNCYIGFSIIDAKTINIGDCVYIGHLNIIRRLKVLSIGSGSRITTVNLITGANVGSFILNANSSVSSRHYFDASADIKIGSNTIIAGRSSQFFSHGITPDNLNERAAITIGDWCYVGSAASFVPGSGIADHTFVGMGSVVTKQIVSNYVLIAGVPAKEKKALSKEAVFFNRPFMPHAHHPSYYKGDIDRPDENKKRQGK